MNSSYDEYLKATQEARINQYKQVSTAKKRSIFLSISIVSVGVVSFLAYNFFQTKSTPPQKSLIAKSVQEKEEFVNEVSSDNIKVSFKDNIKVSSEHDMQDDIQEVAKESIKEYFVVTVKKGDSLASLSKKYFGNEMYFDRILAFNKGLTKQSILSIGQKINIPK